MESIQQHEFTSAELEKIAPKKQFNWQLTIGLVIVVGMILLAIFGPQIAPKDPMREVNIEKIDGEWDIPPFRIFTTGYPLGSDQFGRDIFSRLLWGIRPTLTMVFVVATMRLILGVIIGLMAGWSENRFGRFLNTVVEGAISIPILFVALAVIAATGPDLGIWSFVIGLSLTGWVETSQQVREQTRIIKSQTYIEAARALGSSNSRILISHILRQILSMVMMLFAFEVSSTLMLTAGLGFLGYYIGGDVWIDVSDFVARRVSGMPELGQMLATSWVILTEPWGMIAVGTVVFITILGFNLIGEGLRINLNVVRVRRNAIWRISERTSYWLDQNLFHPARQILNIPIVRAVSYFSLITLIVWFVGIGYLWPMIKDMVDNLPDTNLSLAIAEVVSTPTPENEIVDQDNDEIIKEEIQIAYTTNILWEQKIDNGFATGAVFDPSRKVFYAATRSGFLHAYNLNGEIVWEKQLPEMAFNSVPVLDDDGNIYLADTNAGLMAISPEGMMLWHFISDAAPNTVSGPILSNKRIIYYVVSDYSDGFIQSVSIDGQDLWDIRSETGNFYFPLSISKDGNYLFLREDVIDTSFPSRVEYDPDVKPLRFIGGDDGLNYMLDGQNLYQIEFRQNDIEIIDSLEWDYHSSGIVASEQNAPRNVHITEDQIARYFYTTPGGSSGGAWVSMDGDILGVTSASISGGEIQAEIDQENFIMCGGRSFNDEYLYCAQFRMTEEEPIWNIDLGSNGPGLGGFWKDNTFYFTTAKGIIYAISVSKEYSTSQTTGQDYQRGVNWSFQLDVGLKYGPALSDDGSTFLITDNNELIVLNSDGIEKVHRELDRPLYNLVDGRGWRQELNPFLLPDSVLVTFRDDLTVIGENSNGELLWETQLSSDINYFPHWDGGSEIYITDNDGKLYLINMDGIKWIFEPEIANRPASGLTVGPDGSVYYTLTNLTKGFIQAVSQEGSAIWSTDIDTDSFYDSIDITLDGDLLFIKEEIRKAIDGSKVVYEIPYPINELIVGEDGKKYLRSDKNILQWELSNEGVEIRNTANYGSVSQSPFPPYVRVLENSVIWIYIGAGGGTDIVFMTPDGEILGDYRPVPGNLMYSFDDLNFISKMCQFQNNSLECGTYMLTMNKFEPEFSLENIPDFASTDWYPVGNDFAYILTRDNELISIYLGE